MATMKNKMIEAEITSFSKEGHGIGEFLKGDGSSASVEVPFTVPGDKVTASLRKKEKGIFQSQLENIITYSPTRVQPRCIHFGKCGGCRWQQVSYEDQLNIKQERIRKLFASYLDDKVTLYPIISCTPPWEYRNKMEFSFSSDLAKNRYLGLVLYGSRGKVFNIEECPITHSWFVDAAGAVRKWWEENGLDAYHCGKNTGSLRTLTLREGFRTGDRMVMLTVSGNPDFALNKKQLESFKAILIETIEPKESSGKLSIFLRIQQIAKGMKTNFYEMLLYGPDHIKEILQIFDGKITANLSFKISPSAFFQPNTYQAERLYSRALELAGIPENGIIYDLYCGTGTLGICAAKRAKEVIGIELSPEAVLDARENAKTNGLSNVKVYCGDVGITLARLSTEEKKKPDLVMVDPPRSGLDHTAIKHILELKAPKILYVSCNPATQAANIEEFLKEGYRLESIQAVDQFPQTIHVENIVVLSLQNFEA